MNAFAHARKARWVVVLLAAIVVPMLTFSSRQGECFDAAAGGGERLCSSGPTVGRAGAWLITAACAILLAVSLVELVRRRRPCPGRGTLALPREAFMTPMQEFLRHWEPACERKGLPKLVAEVFVTEAAQSQAARLSRELLLACALGPWETDEVLSEIALLTLTDDDAETWQLRRLTGPQAAVVAGGRLSAHFAKSFILAAWVRPSPPAKSRRSHPSSAAG